MPVTIDQVKEALQTPEIKTEVLNLIKADGFVIRSKDEDATYIANHEKNVIPGLVSQQIGDKIKEVHDRYDQDIFDATGLKKDPNEKTYEFTKRVLKNLKEQAEKAGKDGDKVLRDQLNDLTTKLKGYDGYVAPDEVNKIKSEYEKKEITFRVTSSLDKKPIAAPAHITDEKGKQAYAATQRNLLRTDFMGRFTAKQNGDGKTVYYEGETLLTNTADASPMTEEQIIDKYYGSYFVPEKKPAGGAGSGASGGSGDPGEATLKTKADVMTYLQDVKKLIVGGRDYNKEFQRIMQEQGITN